MDEVWKKHEALPGGFRWGAVRAGIKASGKPDVAIALTDAAAQAAAMYTTNQVVAAPVTVGRRHMASTGGRVGVVLVNAGNANCATGQAGIEACEKTCVAAAETFGYIFDEARAHAEMQQRDYTISIDMGQDDGECSFVTCDLTAEYVRINADYST